MAESKCVLMRGFAGCGKSTKAKALADEWGNTVICSADDFWIGSDGIYRFDVTKLKAAHDACYNKFKKAVEAGQNVIIDNTNIKFEDCKKYFDFILKNNNLNKHRYQIDIVEHIHNDIKTAVSLRKDRPDGKNIPEARMYAMYDGFKRNNCIALMLSNYQNKIEFVYDKSSSVQYGFLENSTVSENPDAVICDLDGTLAIFKLADGTELRNPFNAETCESDLINVAVAKVISAMEVTGTKVIFLSGRESKFRTQTLAFLARVSEKFGINKDVTLIMRAEGDFRSDDIIKSEIYHNHIADKYNVVGIFDDRPKVVRMWRALGLFVFDCNYRQEEF